MIKFQYKNMHKPAFSILLPELCRIGCNKLHHMKAYVLASGRNFFEKSLRELFERNSTNRFEYEIHEVTAI